MPTVNLSAFAGAGIQFFDNNGDPAVGWKLYTKAAGTSTPKATYTDNTGGTTNPNPIVTESDGRLESEIWLIAGDNYKFTMTDASDVEIFTADNIPGVADFTASIAAVYANFANTSDTAKGDALVGFRQSNSSGILTGAAARTVHQKLQEYVSIVDFGASTSAVDNSVAIQAALDSSNGGIVHVPHGTYAFASTLTVPSNVRVIGDAPGTTSDSGIPSVLSYTGAAVAIKMGDGTTAGNKRGRYSELADLNVQNTGTGTVGVFINDHSIKVTNVRISDSGVGFSTAGIQTTNAFTTSNIRISNCLVSNCGIGINIRKCNGVTIQGCYLQSNANNIVASVEVRSLNIVDGCVLNLLGTGGAETNTSVNVVLSDVDGFVIRDFYAKVAADVAGAIGQRLVTMDAVLGGSIENGFIATSSANSIAYPLISTSNSNVSRVTIQNNKTSGMGTASYLVGQTSTGVVAQLNINNNYVPSDAFEYYNVWHPVLRINASTAGITCDGYGTWARNGSQMTVWFELRLSVQGASVGKVTIIGLPIAAAEYPPGAGSDLGSSLIWGYLQTSNLNTATIGSSICSINDNSTTLRLWYSLVGASSAYAEYADTDITSSTTFNGMLTYPIRVTL